MASDSQTKDSMGSGVKPGFIPVAAKRQIPEKEKDSREIVILKRKLKKNG